MDIASLICMILTRCMIIWGCVTTVLGVAFFFFLPDKPKSRWFRLTPDEEKIVNERTRDNTVIQNKQIRTEHMLEALKEPRFYAYVLISFLLDLQNGCVTIFSSQIIADMGFSVSKKSRKERRSILTSSVQ